MLAPKAPGNVLIGRGIEGCRHGCSVRHNRCAGRRLRYSSVVGVAGSETLVKGRNRLRFRKGEQADAVLLPDGIVRTTKIILGLAVP